MLYCYIGAQLKTHDGQNKKAVRFECWYLRYRHALLLQYKSTI